MPFPFPPLLAPLPPSIFPSPFLLFLTFFLHGWLKTTRVELADRKRNPRHQRRGGRGVLGEIAALDLVTTRAAAAERGGRCLCADLGTSTTTHRRLCSVQVAVPMLAGADKLFVFCRGSCCQGELVAGMRMGVVGGVSSPCNYYNFPPSLFLPPATPPPPACRRRNRRADGMVLDGGGGGAPLASAASSTLPPSLRIDHRETSLSAGV